MSSREALAPFLKHEEARLLAESAAPAGPFQYILCAATSPAVKQQDESLTYLNQGRTPSSQTYVSQRWSSGITIICFLWGFISAATFNSIKIEIKYSKNTETDQRWDSDHLSHLTAILFIRNDLILWIWKSHTTQVEEGALQCCTVCLQQSLPDHSWADVFWCFTTQLMSTAPL